MPVLAVDTGGTTRPTGWTRWPRARCVDNRLAASVPPGSRDGGNRVLVLNGVGTPGLGALVRERIVPAGFAFVDSRNARRADGTARFDYPTSSVVVLGTGPDALAAGRRLAAALGLPASAVQISDRNQSVADLLVVVGADFVP